MSPPHIFLHLVCPTFYPTHYPAPPGGIEIGHVVFLAALTNPSCHRAIRLDWPRTEAASTSVTAMAAGWQGGDTFTTLTSPGGVHHMAAGDGEGPPPQ